MHDLITDRSFDLNRTKEYKLSIQVSLDGFSFSMVRIYDNRLVGLKNVPVKISTEKFVARRFTEWMHSEEIFNYEFSEIHFLYSNENFTLLPRLFYQEEKRNEIAAILFEQEVISQIVSHYDEASGIQLLFTLPDNLFTEIKNKFGDCNISHPAVVLAKKCPSIFNEDEHGAALYFSKNSFLLSLYSEKKLLLTNRFNYSHTNDVVYYLTAVLNQFKVNPGSLKILLTGDISKNSETELLLTEYFSKPAYWYPEIPLNTEIFKSDLHRFITLL